MKFFSVIIYTLKVNLLQVLVNNCRSHSISLQFIDSSIFEASTSSKHPDEYADGAFVVNITDIPIM
ncbi:unnamed protein product [Debaryomyces fabryi]|nr:unnamed protein product [Debaryomyces fabryi]